MLLLSELAKEPKLSSKYPDIFKDFKLPCCSCIIWARSGEPGKRFAIAKELDPSRYPLPVTARNKVGDDNNLWYEEVVPAKSVFFTLILSPEPNLELDFARHSIIQFGGNASIGRGFTKCSIIPMPAAQNGGAE